MAGAYSLLPETICKATQQADMLITVNKAQIYLGLPFKKAEKKIYT